ncbi:hypothetical protein VN12_06240 [Pirellula sp. SH-Sr6A]|nr:hypothetical protein VN12_06240 [Pirellula sp. SH-Sr6A]
MFRISIVVAFSIVTTYGDSGDYNIHNRCKHRIAKLKTLLDYED